MNKLLISSLATLCLVSAIAGQPALANNKAGTVVLTAGGGYDYFSSKRHVENSGVGYGMAGYNFTDQWGIEALLGFFNTQSRHLENFGTDVTGTMFAVNAVYHFTPYKKMQAYVLAGPGIMGFNPNGTDAHNEGNLNAAVGVEIFADEAVALRLEARDFYTFVGGKNDVFLNGGVTFFIPT